MIRRLNDYFNVSENSLKEKGVFNSFIGIDTKVFLDPLLLENLTIPEFTNSRQHILDYYNNVVTLLKASRNKNDVAWKAAYKQIKTKEVKGVSIGYGNKTDNGSAIGPKLAERLTDRAKEIVDLGIESPEIFELVGLYEADFGADRLSDITIKIILKDLLSFSQRIIQELGITNTITYRYQGETFTLAKSPSNKAIVLIPEAALRDLPIANDWDEIEYASYINEELRQRVNQIVGVTWKENVGQAKREITSLLMSSPEVLEGIVTAYRNSEGEGYDFENDPNFEVKWLTIGQKFASENPIEIQPPSENTIEEMYRVLDAIVTQYKKLIETNGLNQELYNGIGVNRKEKHEGASQRLFYAVADSYCEANNIDISRESNAGSGAVDFKFSQGYANKILVEVKLSKNPGLKEKYTSQVSTYEASEATNESIYLVVRVTEHIKQLNELIEFRDEAIAAGKKVPKLYIVDGRIRPSASRR